jgi:hypothetical protein
LAATGFSPGKKFRRPSLVPSTCGSKNRPLGVARSTPSQPRPALGPRREVLHDRPAQGHVCGTDQNSLVHARKDHPVCRRSHHGESGAIVKTCAPRKNGHSVVVWGESVTFRATPARNSPPRTGPSGQRGSVASRSRVGRKRRSVRAFATAAAPEPDPTQTQR